MACTLTPTRLTSTKIRRLNELIRAYASEKDLVLVDLFYGLVDVEGNLRQEYSDDGVHLTQTGYRRIAEIVLGAIVPLIERWSSDQ